MNKLIFIFFALSISVFSHDDSKNEIPEFDTIGFSQLPVQYGGRVQPLDSIARNTLLILSGKQTAKNHDGKKITAVEWFLDICMRPEIADNYRIFKIEFPDDLGLDGLSEISKRYYSFNDLKPYFEVLDNAYKNIEDDVQKRNPYERQIAEIYDGLQLYYSMSQSLHPNGKESNQLNRLIDEYKSYEIAILEGHIEISKQISGKDFNKSKLDNFYNFYSSYMYLSEDVKLLRIIPPSNADDLNSTDEWSNVGNELIKAAVYGSSLNPVLLDFAELTMAYRSDDIQTFNNVTSKLRESFIKEYPTKNKYIEFEFWFNSLKPFAVCIQLYILTFIILLISWLKYKVPLNNIAWWLLLITFIIHSFGLIARMYIQGRPPVTNLYSSAVFVGWGAVLIGIIIEKFHKSGIGGAMASLVGFTTLIIAHHLSMSGDTLEMMRAVLDSNFWLATHVIVITLGYSAMFFAGALAITFIIKGLLSKSFTNNDAKSIASMVYGVTCFATLFSLIGTILGGIWADQSWGRFWGWDPKENGALMIVITGAIILHARWGGICKERGLMALAILGNIITAWSWFGTNLLGVGLHSYGFTNSGFVWMLLFIISQLLIIALAYLPWTFWKSKYAESKYVE